jgi:hypothetical protein
VQTLRNAAADIDLLLTVAVDQVPDDDSTVLRLAASCNRDPDGIEAVQEIVAAAPALPPRVRARAFTQPTLKQMARELGLLEIRGEEVPVQQKRFMAEPSATAPGAFDVACFVPHLPVTEMNPQSVPGTLVADIMQCMGIGELRVMTLPQFPVVLSPRSMRRSCAVPHASVARTA